MTIFFTSDSHWGHANVIRHDNRPFANVDEMDEALINNWNRVVTPRDEVWHLGDFAFRTKHTIKYYTDRLNGKINIIWGNHDDKYARKCPELFNWSGDMKYLRINNERITLCHYPLRSWRTAGHGAWSLYGHCHGKAARYDRGKTMDVGVNLHNYTPISFEEIKKIMDTKVSYDGRLEFPE